MLRYLAIKHIMLVIMKKNASLLNLRSELMEVILFSRNVKAKLMPTLYFTQYNPIQAYYPSVHRFPGRNYSLLYLSNQDFHFLIII